MRRGPIALVALAALVVFSCGVPASAQAGSREADPKRVAETERIENAMEGLPAGVLERFRADPDRFFLELGSVLRDGGDLLPFVDKSEALAREYEPPDLVSLDGTGLTVSKKSMTLRAPLIEPLCAMAKAAETEGVTLVFSSAYRSWDYQKTVYERNVRQMGQEATDRVSARPGHSQHQTGTAFDMGSIDDTFASTKAGRWMRANAWKFGFSMSYPEGMETVTGYRHESWHFRFLTVSGTAMERDFFGGIQQHFLVFLDRYRKASKP